jgi:hypothetical protein
MPVPTIPNPNAPTTKMQLAVTPLVNFAGGPGKSTLAHRLATLLELAPITRRANQAEMKC